jgi:hypothetical protein
MRATLRIGVENHGRLGFVGRGPHLCRAPANQGRTAFTGERKVVEQKPKRTATGVTRVREWRDGVPAEAESQGGERTLLDEDGSSASIGPEGLIRNRVDGKEDFDYHGRDNYHGHDN